MTKALLWSFFVNIGAQVIFINSGFDEVSRMWAGGISACLTFYVATAGRSLSLFYPLILGLLLQVIISGALGQTASVLIGSIGFAATVFFFPRDPFTSSANLKKGALFLIGYTLAIRAFLASDLNLLEQEAYYWKYAENLSLGYLDHPPLVGWSIALGTALFKVTELGVRCMALVWWGLGAIYVWKLADFLYDRSAAWGAVALFSVLPYFLGAGFIMSPDAPLLFFWAAALYYCVKLIVTGESRNWIGVALSLGGGLLAKYPIALVGIALCFSLLAIRRVRLLAFRWEPFAAAIGILILFSPVLLWNYEHAWASFVFQGPDRIVSTRMFSFHLLALHVLVILTPIGIRDLFVWMKELWPGRLDPDIKKVVLAPFLLIPLAIFILFSLENEVKINWTGPVFLAALPFLGFRLAKECKAGHKAWLITMSAVLISGCFVMSYFTTGIPAVPYGERLQRFVGWQKLIQEVSQLEDALRRERGEDIVVVGMDKHYTGSIAGFYRAHFAYEKGEGRPLPTVGRHLFGEPSLSFQFWSKPDDFRHKTLLLLSRYEWDIREPIIGHHAHVEGPPAKIIASRGASQVGSLYYRIVHDYEPEEINHDGRSITKKN